MVDIKAVKNELLTAVTKKPPTPANLRSSDVLDIMLTEYFNKASTTPRDYALSVITTSLQLDAVTDDVTEKSVKKILDKYEP